MNVKVFRTVSQIVFLALMTYVAVSHQIDKQGVPPVDALCPFGGLASLYKIVTSHEHLMRTNVSNIVLLAGLLIAALVVGKSFCSWICPFGTIQEWLGNLGRKLFGRNFRLPEAIDRTLSYLKYVVLILVLAFTWYTGDLVFHHYDPWVAYAHLYNGVTAVFSEFPVGLSLLALTFLLAVFTDRPWCRYACPLGAVLEILGRFGVVRLKRNEDICVNCDLCRDACARGLKEHDPYCDSCADCVKACPLPGAIGFTWGRKAVSPIMVGVLTLGILLGSYAFAKTAGIWNTKGSCTLDEGKVSLVLPATELLPQVNSRSGSDYSGQADVDLTIYKE